MKMKFKMNTDINWLKRMAKDENYGCVSAGGLYARMLDEQESMQSNSDNLYILGRFVGLARRQKGLSLAKLSETANIGLDEALKIEEGRETYPQPRTIFKLAEILDLPKNGMMELAGIMQPRNKSFSEAAIRFAAKSEPTAKLTHSEKEALQEFIKVLTENSN